MNEFVEQASPTGHTYRHQPTGTTWAIELEIGGAVWMTGKHNEIRQLRLDDLETPEWHRIN